MIDPVLLPVHLVNQLIVLCQELDEELDGVRLPKSAAAICNGIRDVLQQMAECSEDEENSDEEC